MTMPAGPRGHEAGFRSRTAVAVLALLFGASATLSSQAATDTTRFGAQDLLRRAPLLQDSMTVVEESDYVEEVLAFFHGVARPDSLVRIRSGRDAVRALEGLLAPDSVSAHLQSDPPGFRVHYYRIADGSSTSVETTTDTTLILPAGLYRFGFFNTRTGELREQGRACLQDCSIRWRF